MSNWKNIQRKMTVGRMVDDRYRVVSVDDLGINVERVATGSKVRITRKMIEKTEARLAAGETIGKRQISYTVAVENLVVLALGKTIRLTEQGYKAGS